jgi:hypothetical protein
VGGEGLTAGAQANPFITPFDRRKAQHAAQARARLSRSSDALAVIRARDAVFAGGGGGARAARAGLWVSAAAQARNERQREAFARALQRAGFLDCGPGGWAEAVRRASGRARDWALVRAVLGAGQFPHVAQVLPTGAVVCGASARGRARN